MAYCYNAKTKPIEGNRENACFVKKSFLIW